MPPPVADITGIMVTLTGADDFVAEAERTKDVTIPAGATGATQADATITFPITNDDDHNEDAVAIATITSASSAYQLGVASATAIVRDDDAMNPPPGVPIGVTAYATSLTLEFEWSPPESLQVPGAPEPTAYDVCILVQGQTSFDDRVRQHRHHHQHVARQQHDRHRLPPPRQ